MSRTKRYPHQANKAKGSAHRNDRAGAADDQGSILVGGDFVIDRHIYEGRRKHYGDSLSRGVHDVREVGGARVVHCLLKELLGQKEQADGKKQAPPPAGGWASYESVKEPAQADSSHHAYAFWRPFPQDAPEGKQYWRVSEAMGFGETGATLPSPVWPTARHSAGFPKQPKIIVFSEGGMGFREQPDCWKDLELGEARWIVLKTAAPVASGQLWRDLVANHAKRLVVIVSARELRKSAARISAGLSWEATIESLLRELRESSDLQPLTRCRHLLVIFESEGAAWLDFSERTTPANAIDACRVQFVYDAAAIEGEHARQIKGTAFGFLSCLAASVAWQMTRNLETPDFAAALEQGLSAMRDLREKGHGSVSHPGAGFPAERLAAVIKDPGYRFSRAEFPGSAPKSAPASPKSAGMGPSQAWSLLVDSQRCRQRTDDQPAYELARLVLLNGPIALYDVPHVGIGNLIAVHRDEIESLRTLDQLICRYRDHDKGKLPLSIGIFGPPGSGKSFAVSQLAEALLGKQRWLEFNLSQFDTLAELNGAFHQIRDRVLQQQLPVAFFDEFDSQHYRWLQYLLAPMQDGKFQQGQLTHTLGKCIFVFAGATSLTFETFGPPAPSQDALDDERKAHREFVLAKGPDFRSRLDAYLDVVGPNRRMVVAPPDKKAGKSKRAVSNGNNEITETISGYSFREDLEDLTFPISRALMIRSKLGCARDEKLDIDEALVRALLRAERYRHGARSLDKILQPLQAARPGRLQRSLLPPRGQLDMQTHATGFLAQCDGAEPARTVPPMSEADVAAVAPAIHRVWRELGRKGGWLKPWLDAEMADLPAAIEKYNKKQKDPEERKPPWLGKFLIESNREAAGRMPEILDIVGLRLASGRWAADEEAAVRQHLEYHLELLAEAEHHRWMQWHLQQGWRYAAKKDEDHKRHDCLLPFAELAEVQKNKDRDAIRHYPDFAKEAGKKIVFAAADDPHATKPRRSAAKP